MTFEDFDFGNILLDEKSYKNILIQKFDWRRTFTYYGQ